MKRLISFLILITISATTLFGQTNIPQLVSFSAVVRDANNELLINTPVSVRLTFREGGQNGDKVYCGLQQTTTNQNGFMSVQLNRDVEGVGCNGAPANSFEEIPWENGNFWMEVQYQTGPTSDWVDLGQLELASSFYAFASATAESINGVELSGANNGDVLTYNSTNNQWEPSENSGGGEYQSLSVSSVGDTLYLSNANWVIIPGISYYNSTSGELIVYTTGSNVTNTSITVYAETSGGGEILQRGVCWSTSPNPTIDDNYTVENLDGNNDFYSTIENLSANTIYYLRPYAINSSGIAYGDEVVATTENQSINDPGVYAFTDENGNNTVSYTGQTARMDMLSEMVNYMKTANGYGGTTNVTLDASTLLAMYDNSYTDWSDPSLVGNGKQLKSKTAMGDAGIQAQFEGWMVDAAAATPSDNYEYLQSETGLEWTQMVEKGLMSACFASQMTANYLAGIESDDNTVAVDPSGGKYYTEMEHHWDEAYGYFTSATDYPTSGTDRFWGKYANKSYLEDNLGSATDISTAFRTGRAALSAHNTADALAQRDIIIAEVKQMQAGMAIHYLNDVKSKVSSGADQSAINHSMSEALAFIFGIQFISETPDMSSADVMALVNQIEPAVAGFTMSLTSINAVIDQVAAATGLESVKDLL